MSLRIYLLFIYVLLCVFSLYNVNSSALRDLKKVDNVGFAWANCGPLGQPIEMISLSIGPEPVKLPGDVFIAASVNLSKPFPADLTAIVVMEKNIAGIFIKIPCEGNVGSCTYRDICTNRTQIMSIFPGADNLSKKCPSFPPAVYSVSNLVLHIAKSIPSIADGVFRITVDFLSNSIGQLGCVQVYIGLSS